MKRVIVRLGNGLGNQLFTYAAAYSFAKKNNAELYVDDESGFHKRYKYELHNFNISAKMVGKRHKFLGFLGRVKLYKKFCGDISKNVDFFLMSNFFGHFSVFQWNQNREMTIKSWT